ncbi:M48 family metallopeptidase [Fulvivirgaceae bacterium PWU5]|uniref:M48 family metallopeptidase n=1 Tax=Dawidia cretensis TaxID=2782350 RepID=A0AAP2E5A9_9BACT|nr:M48 family metallopeptidase [Dawidia cretensis]MBT1712277.1 M48 family metallopeptidase [Dawidia cretensis]
MNMNTGNVCLAALGLVLGLLFVTEVNGQPPREYAPRNKAYTEDSEPLKEALRKQLAWELRSLDRTGRSKAVVDAVRESFRRNTKGLLRMVDNRAFLKNDTLQYWVDTVMSTVAIRNAVPRMPVRTLILRAPVANAICFSEGTFVVTTGLLAGIRTEDELAFALAHELAHYSLEHARKSAFYKAEKKVAKKLQKTTTKILSDDDAIQENLDTLRSLVYTISRYSRRDELQADSLGLMYMKKAGYRPEAAYTALLLLDSVGQSPERLGLRLFEPFQIKSYPFQDYWLAPRPSMYSSRREGPIFAADSVLSHPEAAARLAALPWQYVVGTAPDAPAYVRSTIALAEFKNVEAAINTTALDYALLQALRLKHAYPQHDYPTAAISRILLQLVRLRGSVSHVKFVPAYVQYYSQELRMVNTFLHNLQIGELGELAFNFLNNRDNFNPASREHYFLLWHICDLTGRPEVAGKVKANYVTRFGKDDVYSKLKSGPMNAPLGGPLQELWSGEYRFPHAHRD